jgi:CRP-like cAMP-binding protein
MAHGGQEAIMGDARQTMLERSALFRGIGPEALAKISKAAQRRHLTRGAKLANEAGMADFVHLIVSGSFKLSAVGSGGSAITLQFAREGDVVGEAGVLAGAPSSVTATAMLKGESLCWPAAIFVQLAQEVPQLAFNCVALAVRSEQRMVRRICASLGDKVERRVAGALVELAAVESGSESAALLPVGGKEIAELSDTTVYTVSRVIASWKRAGIVAGGRRRITVIDPKRLLRAARI